ncbi:MAG: ATP synthase F1 subunit delta [Chloroflexi bacterium]|nr:MAG: ATP synthase F1 subunit delta [Chloroflexota bacterium]
MEASPRVYARAVYETAVGDWLEDLRKIRDRLERRALVPILDDPAKAFDEKKRILDEVLGPDIDRRARNFMYTLASNNDVSLLDEVIADYERLLRQGALELPLAQVTTAIPLTDSEREAIEQRLRRRFGEEVEITYQVEPSIIGGVIVRVGDKYVDGSIATKLETMRERLVSRQ